MTTENRDIACAAEVGRMAELGRFDHELNTYGTAYLDHGKVIYRLSSTPFGLYRFVHTAPSENLLPTTVLHNSQRTQMPAGMKAQLAFEAKLALAAELHASYPRLFFESLATLSAAPPKRAAAPYFQRWQQKIIASFDDLMLQLFEETLLESYHSKQLDRYDYTRFKDSIAKVRRQMDNDPVPGTQLKRTLYGFVVQECDQLHVVFDAVSERVASQYAAFLLEGQNVAPMLHRTYWLENFSQMPKARQDFKRQLLNYENTDYFTLRTQLHALSPAVNEDYFQRSLTQLEQLNTPLACADLRRYGRMWNLNVLV